MVVVKRILVTGAAGYIGSNLCVHLADSNFDVIAVDRNSQTLSCLPDNIKKFACDICSDSINDAMTWFGQVDACIHLAAETSVPESVVHPVKYHYNNVYGSLNTIKSCLKHGVGQFIFSSSAAVYGDRISGACKESDPVNPMNPYGKSKAIVESILDDVMIGGGIRVCSLRYFNVAGNDQLQRVQDLQWKNKTNLFPACMKAIKQITGPLTVYGKDYSTVDGTALRDYIHVTDLVEAHRLCLQGNLVGVFNIGTGTPMTVEQIIDEFRKQGNDLSYQVSSKRNGDPCCIFSDPTRFYIATGWRAKRSISEMVSSYCDMIGRIYG